MSEKSTAYLRLTLKEVKSLIAWFMFQEHAHREEGEPSTLTIEEIKLLNKIKSCALKMADNPDKYAAMRLSPEYCKIVYDWYENLPDCLIEDVDADIHAALGMFLVDCEKEQKEEE
jgi:hypothetical protein